MTSEGVSCRRIPNSVLRSSGTGCGSLSGGIDPGLDRAAGSGRFGGPGAVDPFPAEYPFVFLIEDVPGPFGPLSIHSTEIKRYWQHDDLSYVPKPDPAGAGTIRIVTTKDATPVSLTCQVETVVTREYPWPHGR